MSEVEYSDTLSLLCPYCNTKTQFKKSVLNSIVCEILQVFQDIYICTHCNGLILLWRM